MKTKIIKTLILFLTLALAFTASSCGKSETTETDLPVNQDKVVEEKDTESDKKDTTAEEKDEKTSDKKEETDSTEQKKNPQDKPQNKPTPEVEKPAADSPEVNIQEPQTPDTPAETTPSTTAPSLQTASAYIGKSAASLAAAIGQPSGKTYVTSCIGDGEDGEWYYPGFTVYTYRDPNGSEKVIDVLAS